MKLIGCDNLVENNNIVNLTNLIGEGMESVIFKVLGRAWNEVVLLVEVVRIRCYRHIFMFDTNNLWSSLVWLCKTGLASPNLAVC